MLLEIVTKFRKVLYGYNYKYKTMRQVNYMLIPVKIKDYIEIEDIEIENINFKSLNLREEHIEEFLRKNIEVIF